MSNTDSLALVALFGAILLFNFQLGAVKHYVVDVEVLSYFFNLTLNLIYLELKTQVD